jgi:hypothetical protein
MRPSSESHSFLHPGGPDSRNRVKALMHAWYVGLHPPAGAYAIRLGVEELLRLPPLTLFALEDNQSSA